MLSVGAPGRGNDYLLDCEEHYLRSLRAFPLLKAEEEVVLAKRIEAGVYAAHLLGTSGNDHRYAPEELEQIRADGQAAHRQMIEANARLVPFVAWRYRGRGMDYPDLIAEGNFGLLRAVEKFDYTKGAKFSTYAVVRIQQAIMRGLQDRTAAFAFRLPSHIHERLADLDRQERYLQADLGHEATPDELARAADLPVSDIVRLRAMAQWSISLNQPLHEEDDSDELGELIPQRDLDGITYDLAEQISTSMALMQVRDLLTLLTEREARILSLRYGLVDGRPRSPTETSQEFGLSRQRIHVIAARALAKLRADPAACSLARAVLGADPGL
ncbi:sigma-70 family RNA polymerase sigma factor [Nonomuraea sp. NPDC049784]|uniref:sigma-70 family RNA polymerase sigma factor n=1 Tax=Nonomuraea sp. NPDC049784 TaxID=3154361 RepID=UPI003401D36A